MNPKEKLILVKNAVANVLRGSTAALVAVLLPPFLTRLMSHDAFSAWSLVLQISAYVGYLDFGIQTAVGRFVAHCNEIGDVEQRDKIVSTSFVALVVAGLLGIGGTLVTARLFPVLFHQMPDTLLADSRVAFIVAGISLAIGLPASIFNGVFVGLQRYEVPAVTVGVTRILSAVLLVVVARQGASLTKMALVMAAVNLLSYALQFAVYRVLAPKFRLSPRLASRAAGRELFNYCVSLTIWSFAMLLVTGLDLMIVGHFQFEAVGAYAVAATLVTFLVGLQQAVFNVMIPSAAVQHARGDSNGLGRLVVTATRYGLFLLLLSGIPLIGLANRVLILWVGPGYAFHAFRVLQLLVLANIIRLSALPYVMALIGTGQQRLVIVTPVLEGVTNVVMSILGAYWFGAIGVALGTLTGAVVGVGGNVIYNMPRSTGIDISVPDYLRGGLMRPAVCAVPLAAMFGILEVLQIQSFAQICVVTFISFAIATYLFWRFGLVGSERSRLRVFAA